MSKQVTLNAVICNSISHMFSDSFCLHILWYKCKLTDLDFIIYISFLTNTGKYNHLADAVNDSMGLYCA